MPHYTPAQSLWLNALSTPQSWPSETKEEAHARRFKLYNMRRKWRRDKDPFASIADQVECVVKEKNGRWYTILQETGFDVWDFVNTAIPGDPTKGPAPTPTPAPAELTEEEKRLLAFADAANERLLP